MNEPRSTNPGGMPPPEPGDFAGPAGPITTRVMQVVGDQLAARFEDDRRKSLRGTLTLAGTVVAALTGIGVLMAQFGVVSPEGGWAWMTKAQYAKDRDEDLRWRASVNETLKTLLERSRGRR